MRHTCLILVLDGVADAAVGISLDVLGAAARLSNSRVDKASGRASLIPRIVSVDGRPVTSAAGRPVSVDGPCSLRGLARHDFLVVPGLSLATPEALDASLTRKDLHLAQRWIAQAAERGLSIAASCSATFVLAGSGVLDGQEATTTWWLSQELSRRYPRVKVRSDRMVVRSGRIMTAGSAFAHADLMLALLAQAAGPKLAHLVSRYLLIDERPSQARYMVSHHLRTDDPSLRKLERFVTAHLDRNLTISELSRATGVSARTLARRLQESFGVTPLRFVQRFKTERAVHLLETTEHSVESVANQVGYADAAAFRRVLRRETGRSPREFRSLRN